MTDVARVRIGPAGALLAGGGAALALAGDLLAVGGQARLAVWRGSIRAVAVDAPCPAPGVPRFVRDRVYWGPGFVDLASAEYTAFAAAQPEPNPMGGERPHVYAWSPRGDALLASFSTDDPLRPVRVTMYDGHTGAPAARVWEGDGIAPQAAWLGERAAVVGFGDPRVFDRSGEHVADVDLGGVTIAAIEATADERRLIVVDLNRSIAWVDTGSWTVLDRWPGPWLHGAVSPDGRFVAAIEPWGKLHVACLEGDRFRSAGQAAIDANAVALALGAGEIATAGGGEAHRARISVDCGGTP